MGRTKGGLKDDPEGTPAFTAPFSGMASESAVISWAEIGPTKVLGGEGVDSVPVWFAAAKVADGIVRVRMVAHGAGGRGGRAHLGRCPAWKVRGLRFGARSQC